MTDADANNLARMLGSMDDQELNRVIRVAAELVMARAGSNLTCAVHQDDFCVCYAMGEKPAEILSLAYRSVYESLLSDGALQVKHQAWPGRADA